MDHFPILRNLTKVYLSDWKAWYILGPVAASRSKRFL